MLSVKKRYWNNVLCWDKSGFDLCRNGPNRGIHHSTQYFKPRIALYFPVPVPVENVIPINYCTANLIKLLTVETLLTKASVNTLSNNVANEMKSMKDLLHQILAKVSALENNDDSTMTHPLHEQSLARPPNPNDEMPVFKAALGTTGPPRKSLGAKSSTKQVMKQSALKKQWRRPAPARPVPGTTTMTATASALAPVPDPPPTPEPSPVAATAILPIALILTVKTMRQRSVIDTTRQRARHQSMAPSPPPRTPSPEVQITGSTPAFPQVNRQKVRRQPARRSVAAGTPVPIGPLPHTVETSMPGKKRKVTFVR
ncbi:hypothetical protein [Absidia glauca]|uniref:Uncharacterized protein n=1 Tax=Absidia glauca TaxID=4829 RepID=A0A163KZA5_ABSGL|nr:hypothetical protein [Absidia glauca]